MSEHNEYAIYNKRTKHIVLRNLDYEEMMCALDDCHCFHQLQDGDIGIRKWGNKWVSQETGETLLDWKPIEIR